MKCHKKIFVTFHLANVISLTFWSKRVFVDIVKFHQCDRKFLNNRLCTIFLLHKPVIVNFLVWKKYNDPRLRKWLLLVETSCPLLLEKCRLHPILHCCRRKALQEMGCGVGRRCWASPQAPKARLGHFYGTLRWTLRLFSPHMTHLHS